MRKHIDATPCPSVAAAPHRRVSFAREPTVTTNFFPDDATLTANVDFTREWRPSLVGARPRRRPRPAFDPSVDIWAEVGGEDEASAARRRGGFGRQSMGGSMASRADGAGMVDPRRVMRSSAVFERLPPRAAPASRMRMADEDVTATHYARRSSVAPVAPAAAVEPKRSRRLSTLLEGRSSAGDSAYLPPVEEMERERAAEQSRVARDGVLKKDPRRRTIFIPSEDTTIMTIHPGAPSHRLGQGTRRGKSPDFGLDLVTLSEEETEIAAPLPAMSPARETTRARGSRKSLAVKPKRAPLQQSTKGEVNVSDAIDVVGHGGGKENMPPGISMNKDKIVHLDVTNGPADIVIHFDDSAPLTKDHYQSRRGSSKDDVRPIKTLQSSKTTTKKRSGSASLQSAASPAKTFKTRHSTLHLDEIKAHTRHRQAQPPQVSRDSPIGMKNSSLADLKLSTYKSSTRAVGKLPLYYPVVAEDLSKPELYEDHWLGRQEIALSQLLNHLLDSSRSCNRSSADLAGKLRRKLLGLYQGDEFVLAHKRIKASLEFGALAIPREMLAKVCRIGSDVGMRRRFLSLWTHSYDLDVLKSALEAVVGREVVIPNRLSDSLEGEPPEDRALKLKRRALERYIDTFLIRHEDAQPGTSAAGASIGVVARSLDQHQPAHRSQAWTWRRMMLRCLMLILLLDRAKSTGTAPDCLFQRKAEYKSSASIIHALASILFPSLGDVTRPLAHLGYRVACVQYPLEEFEYRVDNLATDLRDGVLLARVVELLLYSQSSLLDHGENTVTVTLPSGEMLQSMLDSSGRQDWTLSQHLKLPCFSRAQRLFNVQVSLSALRCSKRIVGPAAETVTADDIVDGHREKTLGLLWSLVGKFGLELLLDWRGMEAEISRLGGGAPRALDDDNLEAAFEDCNRYEYLLYQWAQRIAQPRGIQVRNLSTSFADGKALEAIVDEYRDLFPPSSHDRHNKSTTFSHSSTTATGRHSMATKLRQIGCSTSFIALFTPSTTSTSGPAIPSQPFVLITLAYLASRLIPPAAARRAAARIQRSYRARRARRTMSQRVALMRLAADCATVVNTRARVVHAAEVLQRAWRAVLARRVERLQAHVVRIQADIRAWMVRRNVGLDGRRRTRRAGWTGW